MRCHSIIRRNFCRGDNAQINVRGLITGSLEKFKNRMTCYRNDTSGNHIVVSAVVANF